MTIHRLLLAASCCASLTAGAAPLGARLDVAPAFPVSSPQTSYFGIGFAGQASGALELQPFLDVTAAVSWTLLTASADGRLSAPGTAFGFGPGVRFKRPMADHLVVPFLEGSVQLVLSGGPRLGLVPTAGVLFRFSETMPVWLGLHLRLLQVFQFGSLPDFDGFHASVLSAGLSFEFFPTPVPEQEPDSDGDGVPDARDRCPSRPGATPDGCPEERVEVDADGDGLLGARDKCPTEPEDKDGFEDDDGCPDLDDDKDGVPDTRDACPREAGGAATEGCPDRDGDGLADRLDACPDKPGKKDDGGCPTYREVVVTAKKIELKQKIHFAFGKTTILPRSEPLLGEVVQALQDRPSLCVRIEGHTDSKGSAADNLKLSAGRAKAVADFLVAKGIEARRLTSKGYGSQLPLDDNATAEGRELNRRVEFVIVPCGELSSDVP